MYAPIALSIIEHPTDCYILNDRMSNLEPGKYPEVEKSPAAEDRYVYFKSTSKVVMNSDIYSSCT